jgi:hypothetical protein
MGKILLLLKGHSVQCPHILSGSSGMCKIWATSVPQIEEKHRHPREACNVPGQILTSLQFFGIKLGMRNTYTITLKCYTSSRSNNNDDDDDNGGGVVLVIAVVMAVVMVILKN